MRYVTHEFAHSETLDRAYRWLIHAGVSPDRMEVRRHGVPRLAVNAEPGEVDSIAMVIHAAELADPDEPPGFWDLARIEPYQTDVGEHVDRSPERARATSFVLAWHPVDASSAGDGVSGEVERQKAYRDLRE